MKRSCVIITMMLCVFPLGFSQQKTFSSFETTATSIPQKLRPDIRIEPFPGSQKSVFLAVVASLIIPGMGEWYAGSFESGKYHLLTEGGLWLAYGGIRRYSNWIGQDARTFANQNAGADFKNKDDQYLVNIGNFNTTEEYNKAKTRNREYDLMYQNSDYSWDWGGSEANRLRFRELRIRSDAVKNNAKFVLAAVVVNHLLSAFSAGRKASAYNRSLASWESVHVQSYAVNTGNHLDGMGLRITTTF